MTTDQPKQSQITQGLSIEGKVISRKAKSLLIGEVSANHDHDLSQALRLVDIAADSGWDCIKLQTYTADSLTMRSNHASQYIDPVWGYPTLYDLYASACMPMDFHEPLFNRARERGLLPFTSVYDPRDVDFIERLGCGIYKIASFEMTFDDLLSAVAQTAKPIILSTGMANLKEIHHALDVLERSNAVDVVLLHCCSAYPAPLNTINLNAMATMEKEFGKMVGFSDHTIGTLAPIAAAAMGAVAIEKHFTSDRARVGPDHRFSALPNEMREIADSVRGIFEAKGGYAKEAQQVEGESIAVGRRSAFALSDLPAGHVIETKDFRFVRPAAGIPPTEKHLLLGRTLRNPISAASPITYGDLV